jgi:hypothetical protein
LEGRKKTKVFKTIRKLFQRDGLDRQSTFETNGGCISELGGLHNAIARFDRGVVERGGHAIAEFQAPSPRLAAGAQNGGQIAIEVMGNGLGFPAGRVPKPAQFPDQTQHKDISYPGGGAFGPIGGDTNRAPGGGTDAFPKLSQWRDAR